MVGFIIIAVLALLNLGGLVLLYRSLKEGLEDLAQDVADLDDQAIERAHYADSRLLHHNREIVGLLDIGRRHVSLRTKRILLALGDEDDDLNPKRSPEEQEVADQCSRELEAAARGQQ